MARGIDTVIVFRVLKLLTTPWKEQAAFEHGLIDEKGKRTKKKPSTSKEKDAYYSIFENTTFKNQTFFFSI